MEIKNSFNAGYLSIHGKYNNFLLQIFIKELFAN